MSKVKDAKRKIIVEEALDLFLARSIGSVTIADVAAEVGVGEASMYRYFGKKQTLVIEAGIRLWQRASGEFLLIGDGSGFDNLSEFYHTFLEVYRKHREFYNFIYEFDLYISGEQDSDVGEYGEQLVEFKTVFDRAYRKGIEDGSVKDLEQPDIFYFSTTHALLNLCKKLSTAGELIHQDSLISKEDEIQQIIDLILYRLKAN